jgi:nucleoside-diphosphate-sugar epimerase
MSLRNKTVLVTGATGFIGSRLVQWLHEVEGARVVALVHQFKNASKLSRFPVELRRGDMLDQDSLAAAVKGCDLIVHAAVTFAGSAEVNRRTTVEGARNLCAAALAAGIKRVVYLSTISVYGDTPPGQLDLSTPCNPADAYGRNKLDAEGVFQAFAQQGLSPVILRLPVVYGPWAFWSDYPVGQLARGRVILPEGGGLCNALYVDDAVRAVVAGLTHTAGAPPATCLISGPAPVTWKTYYEEHGKALRGNPPEILELPLRAIRKAGRTPWYLRVWSVRQEARIFMRIPGAWKVAGFLWPYGQKLARKAGLLAPDGAPPPPVDVWPHPAHTGLMSAQSRIDGMTSGSAIGFTPVVGFAEGMERTRRWLAWAGRA